MTAAADSGWMAEALRLAREAAAMGEVPVGAVVVSDGEIVGRGHNRNLADHDPTAHAEVVALREAARILGNHRLLGATLYVTLEPCPMCVGAMIHARIERLVFGAPDPKTGAAGGRFDWLGDQAHNHRVAVTGEVMAEEAGDLLRAFFRDRRQSLGENHRAG